MSRADRLHDLCFFIFWYNDCDDFLFFLLRETNRRMEEQKNDALRAWREVEELRASKTYRVGETVLKPAKKILGR